MKSKTKASKEEIFVMRNLSPWEAFTLAEQQDDPVLRAMAKMCDNIIFVDKLK